MKRTLTAILVVAAAVAAAATGFRTPTPATETSPVTVAVAPAPRLLVCPDPVRLVVPGTEGDPQFAAAPEQSAVTGTVVSAGGTGGPATLSLTDSGVTTDLSAPGATFTPSGAFTVVGHSETAAAIGGATATLTGSGDLQGLAAAACQVPVADAWLVGGSTATGASTRLVVTNPGSTVATVTYQVYGLAGAVLAVPRTLTLGPGVTKSILLEGIATDQTALAVHLNATGATVAANLVEQRLDGLVPRGVDYVSQSDPATDIVLAPYLSHGAPAGDAQAGSLRLLAPDADATVTIEFVGADGVTQLPGAQSLDLAAGRVFDLPLGGLAAGTWAIRLTATAPIVAGALTQVPLADDVPQTGGDVTLPSDAGADTAWTAPAVAADTGLVGVIPAGLVGTLVLTGPAAIVALTFLAADGSVAWTVAADVAPDALTSVDASGAAAVVVAPTAGVTAGLALADPAHPGFTAAASLAPWQTPAPSIDVMIER